uniref:FtsH protease activity modulator HflK n=1 Tax=Pseudoxanthobacter sp. TaxID=1925742 RepID=UPI002FE0B87C
MPWSNQSGGGGWKGGGPWGGGNNNNGGPWGGGPQRGPAGGPPDLEELLRRSQDRLRTILPGGGGSGPGWRTVLVAGVAVVGLWLATGFYRVEQGEVGVEMVFGRFVGLTQPGLNYNWPYPVGSVETPDVLRMRETTVGLREIEPLRGGPASGVDVPEESLMLTADENIVDVDFKVLWRISSAPDFLFNVQNPEGTVKAVAESAMREVVGRTAIQRVLTDQREQIQTQVQALMQQVLDGYKAGIEISQVQMLKVDPPQQVIDAFRDVQAARADQERVQNEAQAYANRVIPEARGQSASITQSAEGYRDRAIAEAEGQASRFLSLYREYAKAPDLTRERLYLETMQKVLGS